MILVLDFGSQYTQLIARRVRELHVYSEIHPYNLDLAKLRAMAPTGVILSGGPSSVYDERAPQIGCEVFELGVPVLGICYGLQAMAKALGGEVAKSDQHEYGRAKVQLSNPACPLWEGLDVEEQPVWMSHGDRIEKLPEGFSVAGISDNAPMAAVYDAGRRFFGVQFHPEVAHTPHGMEMLANFVHRVCGEKPEWTMAGYIEAQIAAIHAQVGEDSQLVCGLSGGVDSSVAAALVHRAVGDRLTCIFVDNGLLRSGEAAQVARLFRDELDMRLIVVDAQQRFLDKLAGISDPEKKRKVIGVEFIEVFEEEAHKIDPRADFLVQGTLYPDVIESVSVRGPSAVIKSHHNVGGLPERMRLTLVEPLRELFKDEVRRMGDELGLPRHLLWRQPFPGPGLAVRCLGPIEKPRLDVLRQADAIIEEEIRAAGLYESIWQAFGVMLPVQSVGVMGDNRTYEDTLCVRAVHSVDGMTADWVKLPYDLLGTISNRIINEVRGINRVVYDISSKPPATIEWE
ncbi:MAG: glutamine-hydrolyzing GMP synthase [Proteobacteria bacterium]|nr:MAG: glutamine-hydrolyzing GMP synthase [Pseudomonadota bacterium]